MSKKHIGVIITVDTKAAEADYIASLIEKQGHAPLVIDVGPLGKGNRGVEFSNDRIAGLAGWELEVLIGTGRRDRIMAAMGKGASIALIDLLKRNRLDGVIGIGGNQGTAISSTAMRSLPIGFPKVLVSTVASGNLRPYIGHTDIAVMFSVADLVGGPNPVSRSILLNAVSALIGMVERGRSISLRSGEKTVALTALGNTEPSARRITEALRANGYEAVTFHASGAGGTAMEALIEDGVFAGVIDLTPHELAEEVVGAGAYIPVRPGRLYAAGRAGVPQVVSLGALEYLCFGPEESIPRQMRRRKTYFHNPYNANVKTSRIEMTEVGKEMASRLNAAEGPVEVLVPMKGWSIYGSRGGPLYDPRGNSLLLRELKLHLRPEIPLKEIDANINDPEFASACVERIIEMTGKEKK